MKTIKVRNNLSAECNDKLLMKNYDLVYKFNMVYLIGHILILLEFLKAGIWQMALVNVVSVLWFGFNAYKMANSKMERYVETEKRMMIEVILHQIIAFYFVGGKGGFQYILLGCACVMFTLYKNIQGKAYYIFKSLFMIFIFIVLEISDYYYVPRVEISPKLSAVWTTSIIGYTFITSAYFTFKSYTNVIESIEEFKAELLRKNQKIQHIQDEVITSLANLIESRDSDTGEHINRTSYYVNLLIDELKKDRSYRKILDDEFVNNISHAAPMHDIGKIKIRDSILLKPGKLTAAEFEEIKKHTVYGGEIVNDTLKEIEDPKYAKMAYNIAMYHHEKWNGKGYPEGLKGEEIPIEARIMALADVYDALVNERCYKKAYTPREAYDIMKEDMGTHFDPVIGKKFLNIIRKENNLAV